MGWALGLAVCLAVALILGFTAYVLVIALEKIQRNAPRVCSLHEMVNVAGGPAAGAFLEVILVLYLFGICAGFMVIIGDVAPMLLQDVVGGLGYGALVISRGEAVAIASVAIFSICLQRTMSALKWSSAAGIIGALYIAVMMLVRITLVRGFNASGPHPQVTVVPVVPELSGVFGTIPLLCFGLGCHVQVPMVYSELRASHRNTHTFSKVLLYTWGICLGVYLVIGLSGYFLFGEHTPGDILEPSSSPAAGFSRTDRFANYARACVLLTALCGFPLNSTPARAALWSLCRRIQPTLGEEFPTVFLFVETFAFVATAAVVGATCRELQVVFDLFGAVCGSLETLVIPGLLCGVFGYRVQAELQDGAVCLPSRRSCCVVLCVLGSGVTVLGLASTLEISKAG